MGRFDEFIKKARVTEITESEVPPSTELVVSDSAAQKQIIQSAQFLQRPPRDVPADLKVQLVMASGPLGAMGWFIVFFTSLVLAIVLNSINPNSFLCKIMESEQVTGSVTKVDDLGRSRRNSKHTWRFHYRYQSGRYYGGLVQQASVSPAYTEGDEVQVQYLRSMPAMSTVEALDDPNNVWALVVTGLFVTGGIWAVLHQYIWGRRALTALANGVVTTGKRVGSRVAVIVNKKKQLSYKYEYADQRGMTKTCESWIIPETTPVPEVATIFADPASGNACVFETLPGPTKIGPSGRLVYEGKAQRWRYAFPVLTVLIWLGFIYYRIFVVPMQ